MDLKILAAVTLGILVISISNAYSAEQTCCPSSWWGQVIIGSNTSTDGALVSAVISGVNKANSTVGQFSSNKYLIDVPGNAGDNVTFQVWGVNATQQAWTRSGNSTELNLTISQLANGATCSFNPACTNGFCVHSVCRNASTFCGDGFCDTGESCTSDCGSSSSSTSSGGGGAGTAQPVTETVVISLIKGGEAKTITFEKDVNVESIILMLESDAGNVQVKVTKETGKPASVSEPTGEVFGYLTITTSVQDSNVNQAKIKFKVPKGWINDNGADKESVKLNRYKNGWQELDTQIVNEDSQYVYYEAITPGFSVFSITAQKAASPPQPVCAANSVECNGNSVQQCSAEGDKWITTDNCQFGCESGKCIVGPPAPPAESKESGAADITKQGGTIAYVLIGILGLLAVWVVLKKKAMHNNLNSQK